MRYLDYKYIQKNVGTQTCGAQSCVPIQAFNNL